MNARTSWEWAPDKEEIRLFQLQRQYDNFTKQAKKLGITEVLQRKLWIDKTNLMADHLLRAIAEIMEWRPESISPILHSTQYRELWRAYQNREDAEKLKELFSIVRGHEEPTESEILWSLVAINILRALGINHHDAIYSFSRRIERALWKTTNGYTYQVITELSSMLFDKIWS